MKNSQYVAHNLAIARRHFIDRLPRRHEERRTARRDRSIDVDGLES